MANYGFSFSPSASMQQPGAQAVTQPPSQAVEVKSLNLPQRDVPGQLAPGALLSAPGGGGLPMAQLLQMLMAAFQPQGQMNGAMPYAPMPGGTMPADLSAFGPRVNFTSNKIVRPNPVTQTFEPTLPPQRDLSPHFEFQTGESNGPMLSRPDGGVRPSAPMEVGVRPSQPGPGLAPGGDRIDYSPVANPVQTGPLIDHGPMAFPVQQQGFDLGRMVPSYKLGGFAGY